MKTVAVVLAGLALVGVIASSDYSPPVMLDVASSNVLPWTPVVSTDCDVWQVRQSDAAISDVWLYADSMALDDIRYAADDVIEVDHEGTRWFDFRYYDGDQQVYRLEMEVVSPCL